MGVKVGYDIVNHTFLCDGHVDEQDFLEALWEQWDTDYCQSAIGESAIRHVYARFVRGNPGYWKEVPRQGRGTKAITIIDGAVVNLGPLECPTCGHLLMLVEKTFQGDVESHSLWRCSECRTEMEIRRP